MGRLAGPIPDAWNKEVRRLRREKAMAPRWTLPPAPMVHLPAQRRHMALLWFIHDRHGEHGLIVGREGWPPLTRDMRALIKKGHLVLYRHKLHANRIRLTDEGRAALSSAVLSDGDKMYILLSAHYAILR